MFEFKDDRLYTKPVFKFEMHKEIKGREIQLQNDLWVEKGVLTEFPSWFPVFHDKALEVLCHPPCRKGLDIKEREEEIKTSFLFFIKVN